MKSNQKIHQAKLAKWHALLQEQASSPLKVTDWCEQNGVTIHAYYYWKRLVKEVYVDSVIPDIVPIAIGQSSDLQEVQALTPGSGLPSQNDLRNLYNSRDALSSTRIPGSITISAPDMNIEFGPSVSDKLIVSIIKAVRHA